MLGGASSGAGLASACAYESCAVCPRASTCCNIAWKRDGAKSAYRTVSMEYMVESITAQICATSASVRSPPSASLCTRWRFISLAARAVSRLSCSVITDQLRRRWSCSSSLARPSTGATAALITLSFRASPAHACSSSACACTKPASASVTPYVRWKSACRHAISPTTGIARTLRSHHGCTRGSSYRSTSSSNSNARVASASGCSARYSSPEESASIRTASEEPSSCLCSYASR
mmetsp:Transcript_1025/g.2746  ORF Transcript_1025/g.2746 Transcript_1025/m.2746 type:complete len:234 (+) Transcript_1025:360-1061(+)